MSTTDNGVSPSNPITTLSPFSQGKKGRKEQEGAVGKRQFLYTSVATNMSRVNLLKKGNREKGLRLFFVPLKNELLLCVVDFFLSSFSLGL